MRPIDADYLIKEFADRARAARNWKESALNSGNEESAIRADAVLSFLTEVKLTIDNAPTIEERPTGKWIETAKEYYEAVNERCGGVDEHTPYFVDDIACPKCLAMFSTIDNETERFNCCPNCGAKMKEAENE